jgi:hypothetical protein
MTLVIEPAKTRKKNHAIYWRWGDYTDDPNDLPLWNRMIICDTDQNPVADFRYPPIVRQFQTPAPTAFHIFFFVQQFTQSKAMD